MMNTTPQAPVPAQPGGPAHPAAPPPNAGPRCKAKPRDFKDGEDFSLYINHFERVAGANRWSEEEKLVYLETMLRGKAQREFEVFIEETPNITWDDMVTKLKRELIPSKQTSLDAFAQLKMEGKSPRELYASLVRLSNLAHGEMNELARHIIVRAQLIQAIPKKLREDASMHQDLSQLEKEDLLNLLTRIYEATMKENEEPNYEPICKINRGLPIKGTEERVDKLEKENKQLKEDISEIKEMMKGLCSNTRRSGIDQPGRSMQAQAQRYRQRPEPNSDQVKCFRCQQFGHYQRDCNYPEFCTYCQEEGHRFSSCPKYPKNYEGGANHPRMVGRFDPQGR